MEYVSLYRKWRPQVFSQLVGQEHVVRTLTNALHSGRIGHAYLFSGPRGTGKTTVARLLAKGLNCESGPTGSPCGTCSLCVRIAEGHSVDVLEIDGASNRGIDEIREIRERVKYAPAEGAYKVYIIDEVHMLTTEAFNALLKVLEEPPSHVAFVFATTEPHKIPATIVSRCQAFDFRALSLAEIVQQLRQVAAGEQVAVDDEALMLIARHAEGGMRDALGILDQCIAFADGTISEAMVTQILGVTPRDVLDRLAQALLKRDVGALLLLVKESMDAGRDAGQLVAHAAKYFRDLMLLALVPEDRDVVPLPAQSREETVALAQAFGVDRLVSIVETLGKTESDIRFATSAWLPVELAFVQMARAPEKADLDDILQRLEALERRVLTGGVPAQKQGSPTRFERDTVPPPPGDDATGPSAPWRSPGEPVGGREIQSQNDDSGLQAPVTPPAPAAPAASSESKTTGSETAAAGSAPTAPIDPGDVSFLYEVQQMWPRLLEALRARKAVQQAAFLREGFPASAKDDRVVVCFSPNHRFHQANIDLDKNKTIVETVLSQLLGRNVTIETIVGEPPAPMTAGDQQPSPPPVQPEQSPKPSADQAPEGPGHVKDYRAAATDRISQPGGHTQISSEDLNDPLVKTALEMFGGTITKIERKDVDKP